MTAQQVTPELRQWIVAQAQAGHKPEAVLEAMRASGWQEAVALDALEATLSGFLAEHAQAAGLPVPVVVPTPDLTDAPLWLDAGVSVRETAATAHRRSVSHFHMCRFYHFAGTRDKAVGIPSHLSLPPFRDPGVNLPHAASITRTRRTGTSRNTASARSSTGSSRSRISAS